MVSIQIHEKWTCKPTHKEKQHKKTLIFNLHANATMFSGKRWRSKVLRGWLISAQERGRDSLPVGLPCGRSLWFPHDNSCGAILWQIPGCSSLKRKKLFLNLIVYHISGPVTVRNKSLRPLKLLYDIYIFFCFCFFESKYFVVVHCM